MLCECKGIVLFVEKVEGIFDGGALVVMDGAVAEPWACEVIAASLGAFGDE